MPTSGLATSSPFYRRKPERCWPRGLRLDGCSTAPAWPRPGREPVLKGPNLAATDPESGRVTRLFDPRRDDWATVFHVFGAVIAGRTPTGRATVRLLKMNAPNRLDLRTELIARSRWP